MPGNDLINTCFLSCKLQLARLVSRIVPPHEIEDIVQETYVRVCQFNTKAEIREPQALMVTTARNLAIDHLKRAERKLTTEYNQQSDAEYYDLNMSADDTFNATVTSQEFGQFCEAVRLLPPQCRRVFVLKKVYGHSQIEIAKELQLSESTVEKHVAKGLKLCIEFMRGKKPGVIKKKNVSSIKSSRGGRL